MTLVSYRQKQRRRRSGAPVLLARAANQDTPVNWPPEWLAYLRAAWGKLHRRALAARGNDSEWLAEFGRQLPCGACREHWHQMLLQFPPDWGAFFAWSVLMHNQVNAKLGKPSISLGAALARWAPPGANLP